MAWGRAGSTTSSENDANISVSSISDSESGIILNSHIFTQDATGANSDLTFNDSTSGYYDRYNYNNASSDTATSHTNAIRLDEQGHDWAEKFSVVFFVNDSGSNKLCIWDTATNQANISHTQGVGKWENTAVVNKVAIAGKKGADSKLTILGDGTPTSAVSGINEIDNLTNVPAGTRLEETSARKLYYGDGTGTFTERGTVASGFAYPAFNSVYESLNPLTTVAKQRFVEWFKGSLNTNTWVTHNTGSGSGDFVASDYGLRITSTDNGASNIDWSASNPPPTRPFSNTSSVMIIVSKMVQAQYSIQYCQLRTNHYTEVGQQVGFNVQGTTNGNSNDNKIKLITNSGGGNIDTSLPASVIHDWHVYKVTVGNGTSTLSVDGVTSGTGFASTSSNPNERLHPSLTSSITEQAITGGATSYFRYCEVYNT